MMGARLSSHRVGCAGPVVARCAGRVRRATILVAGILLAHVCLGNAVGVGASAPEFDLPVLDGSRHIDFKDLRGKVVFVDFWASWCGPCRQSLPLYSKLNSEFSPREFVMVAINLDEDVAAAGRFLDQHPVNYPVLRDPRGDVPSAFGVIGMPSSYLIDRKGVVRARHVGFEPRDIAKLRAEIDSLLETGDRARQ